MNTETNWNWTSQSMQTYLNDSCSNSPPFVGGHWNDPVPPDHNSIDPIRSEYGRVGLFGIENIYGNSWSYPRICLSANIIDPKKDGIVRNLINKTKEFFRKKEKNSD